MCIYRVLPVPGTSVSPVRPYYNTPNFRKFCKNFIPILELLLVLYDIHTRTRNLCEFCTPRATIPGVRVQHLLYPPGPSVSYVRPCHNTRNFWKFCNTFVPVPETSGSCVRLPYLYPESTNSTEHNRVEGFVETHLCELCVILRSRVLLGFLPSL